MTWMHLQVGMAAAANESVRLRYCQYATCRRRGFPKLLSLATAFEMRHYGAGSQVAGAGAILLR